MLIAEKLEGATIFPPVFADELDPGVDVLLAGVLLFDDKFDEFVLLVMLELIMVFDVGMMQY